MLGPENQSSFTALAKRELSQKANLSIFDPTLTNAGQLVFEDFLRTEYSEENLLFWLACEDYRKTTSQTEITTAKRIYTEFVQVDAPRQINIDCVTRESIRENLSQPWPNCFDRAQRLIYGLMENDCYPRFLKSEMYQALLEQAEQQ
ncbi:regulator of G-protein signaling 8-like [Pseudochaenichthys georgianus]|uniref:regulator of G-protein signaling 8-like n=1 Tax=Pseudochaenichthys georgianus TaxID=52239 RepID=UPI0039C2395A